MVAPEERPQGGKNMRHSDQAEENEECGEAGVRKTISTLHTESPSGLGAAVTADQRRRGREAQGG